MKKLVLISLLSCFLIPEVCFSQDETITFLERFEDIDVNKVIGTISAKQLSDGFIIQIRNESGITKAQLRGANNEFSDNAVGDKKPVSGGFRYIDLKPKPGNNEIDVKVFKGEQSKIVKIAVTPTRPGIESWANCDIILRASIPKCDTPDYSHKFGLLPNDIEKNEIIYIYDFNKETAKRRLYKFSYEKSNSSKIKICDIRPANLSKERLKPCNQVTIKIANLNRFMFDASIEDTLVDYFSEPSALFNRMLLGDSATLLGSLMRDFTDKIKAESNDDLQKMIDAIRCFNSMYASLQAEMMKAYDPCSVFSCCNTIDFKTIILKLNEINSGISILQLEYANRKKELEALKKDKADCKKIEDNKTELENAIKKLNEALAELRKVSNPTEDQKKELKAKEEELKKKQEDLSKLKLCPSGEATTREERIAKLETDLSIVTGLAEIQSRLPKVEDLRVLSVFLMNMVEQNQSLSKGPIQLKGNRLDFALHINSIDSVTKRFGYPSFKDSLHYELPILWTPFVSFSSGSFIGLHERLKNKTYDWQQLPNNNNTITDTSKFILVESGYTVPSIGFAALGNIEWKASPTFGFGFSGGVGITIEKNPRLTYLAGGSLFFGDLRQFAITGGFAGMQVDLLKNNFKAIADQRIIYSTKQSIEYYKEFRLGAFVSLTYTPFKPIGKK